MLILTLFSGPIFLAGTILFFYLSLNSLKTWKKAKEEIFIHLMLLFLAISVVLIMTYFGLFFITFPGQIDKSFLFYVGLFYDLFYLELSFLYLTLFSNSRKFFEKYIPILITIAFLLNFVAGYSQIEPYIEIAIIFHAIVIILGLFILYRAYTHFKISKKYSIDQNVVDILDYLSKIMLVLIIMFLVDGLGFLIMHYWVKFGFIFDEWLIIYLAILILVIIILFYSMVIMVRKKAKNVDLTQLINSLS